MKLKQLAGGVTLCLCAAGAGATDFSFTGNFTYDNDVQSFTFVLGTSSDVTLRSWAYAGGVNAAGQTIGRGGFDPVLALFDADGNKIGEQDDATCGEVAADPVTEVCFDTFLKRNLAAGSYTATIMQWDNFTRGNTLDEGFLYDQDDYRDFRGGFVDAMGDQRDSRWAFDILNVHNAAVPGRDVPEPGPLALLGIGLAAALLARRR